MERRDFVLQQGTEVTKRPTATSLTELIRNEGILGWLSGDLDPKNGAQC